MKMTDDFYPPEKGWKVVPLHELCLIRPPKAEAKKKLNAEDEVSFVPMESLRECRKELNTDKKRPLGEVYGGYTYFANDDVLLAKITPCFENGKLGIARGLTNGIGFGSSEFVVLRSLGAVTPDYLFYFLSRQSLRTEGKKVMSGAVGHKRIPKEFIEEYPTPIPPLAEQERIVSILDEAFAAIETATANAEKNLHNARELFQSVLQDTFSQKGEGWSHRRISDIAVHSLGKMLDKQKNVGEPRPYLRNKNVRWFEFDLTDLLEMKFTNQESEKYTVKKDDVIICEGGYPGRAAIWTSSKAFHFQKALHRLRFHEKHLNKWFVYYLYHMDYTGDLKKHFTGAGIQHLTGKSLGKMTIPITIKNTISEHIQKLDSLSEETKRLETIYERKKAALAELKQSLLQKAFTGQL